VPEPEPQRYSFDGFTVDLTRAALLRDGVQVSLRPRSFDALRFLIENRARLVTKEELVQTLWPRTVVTDDSLVKCIQDVRNALEDDGHRYIKTVPRRGYIFDAPVVIEGKSGADVASDSPKPQPELGPSPPAPRRTAWIGATAALAAVAGIGLFYWLGERTPAAPIPRSIAVLPFESLSSSADDDYFAAGIHESLLTQLAKIDGIKIIARTSVLRYADSEQPIHEIARELNVEAVVEGSVQHADGRVRVTAQLIDPATDTHLWSEEYDRPFADIFTIQTEIATRIATALDLELTAAQRDTIAGSMTRSPEAYELYLRGRYHWDKWTAQEATKSIEYFQQAIRYDANFALAYAGLADAYTALQGLGVAPGAELMPQAKAAIERALAIDPALPEAYVARGLIKHFYDWDYEGGNADFERAIALNPRSAVAHQLYGKNLPVTLQFDRAMAELDIALEIEPFSVGSNKDRGETLYLARRYDEAIAQFERLLEIEPNYRAANYWLYRCYEAQGKYDEAAKHFFALLDVANPADVAAFQDAYRESGWQGLARVNLAQLERRVQTGYVEPMTLVDANLRVGDTDAALEWLERSVELRSAWVPVLAIYPALDPLRGDPRLDELERRASLRPDYIPTR
jgi:TolB-like protein/DNA-binding winged helix-turn-helix (wHTH) protein